MISVFPVIAAKSAVAANPARPASAVVHDSPDARLVVFRLAPGQAVPPHRSESTVVIQVLAGAGQFNGEDGQTLDVTAGDVMVYAPNELHGMRTCDGELLLLATITPRPGTR
ncbi:MAG: cupin domain-containing protein [Gemmatimonadaceae bacterium]